MKTRATAPVLLPTRSGLQIETVQEIQRRQPAGEESSVDASEGQDAIAEGQQDIEQRRDLEGEPSGGAERRRHPQARHWKFVPWRASRSD